VFSVKIAHRIQKALSVLKWVDFCGGKFSSQQEKTKNVKMGNLGRIEK